MDSTEIPFGDTGPERLYRDALAAGRFQIQHCTACGRHVFYPRVLCSHCGATALEWVTPSGSGTVYSTTVIRRKPDAGGDINIALVDLEEGVRMMSRVDGVPPAEVRIGMAVTAQISTDGGQPLVVFVPAKETT